MTTEEPYQKVCTLCAADLHSAHDCHNGRPYTEGFVCQSCHAEYVLPHRLAWNAEKSSELLKVLTKQKQKLTE